jgi:hypothetical protein
VPIGGNRAVGFDSDQARRYRPVVTTGVAKRAWLVRLGTNSSQTGKEFIDVRGREVQCRNPVPSLAHDGERVVVDVAIVADDVDPGREVADLSLPGANPPRNVVRAEKIEAVESATGELVVKERTGRARRITT